MIILDRNSRVCFDRNAETEELTKASVHNRRMIKSGCISTMQTCSYCGKQNPSDYEMCCGCGCALRTPEETPPGPLNPVGAAILGLAALWVPFLIGAGLAGDRDIYRNVLVLPGIALGIFLPETGATIPAAVPAIASVLISAAAGGSMAFAATRNRRLALTLLAIGFVASCGLAAFTIGGMLM